MISRQLELGFENRPGMRPLGRGRRRTNRAHWWFDRMRGIVDGARDWPPTAPPPGEPGSLTPQPASDDCLSEAAPQTSPSAPPATDADAPATPGSHRWHFSRFQRPSWD